MPSASSSCTPPSTSCCARHPRLPSCQHPQHTTHTSHGGGKFKSLPPSNVSLLLSAPIAAYVPPWYAKQAIHNWLRFTVESTRIVVHMDRARPTNFSRAEALEPEWQWLREGTAADRVLVNPLRMFTWRRSGSLLVAHVRNYLFARRALSSQRHRTPSHLLFLASNCFFVRPGVEAFVASRGATAAIRSCPEASIKPNKHHCTTQPWYPELNHHRTTGRRLLIEGQFYPVGFLDALTRQLESRDAKGKPIGGSSSSSGGGGDDDVGNGNAANNLLSALPTVACTVEENLLPIVLLRAPLAWVGLSPTSPPTEPVAWIPKSLSNGSVVDQGTVRWLLSNAHTPQSLCGGTGGCTTCPDAQAYPQTKFIVKRVADDAADRTRVRQLIASLPGASRGRNRTRSGRGGAL